MKNKQKKKLRKSTRYIYFFLGILLLSVSLIELMLNFSETNVINTKVEIYSYKKKFDYNYTVDLIENEFISKDSLGMGYEAYITDLIDLISLNLSYEYTGDKTVPLQIEYGITGKLLGVYTKDGDEQKIWEEDETVLEKKKNTINSDKFTITEALNLDLKDKNDLVKRFEQRLGMSITAKYVLKLNVEVNTTIEGEPNKIKDEKTIEIELGKKTTKIDGEKGKEDTNYISKELAKGKESNALTTVIYIVVAIVGLQLLRYVSRTKNANTIRNEYRQEINRILKICQDKIVKIDTKPNETNAEIVNVKDFGEIVKLSEELFKPILYWEDKERNEAWFIVMSNNVLYEYVIKSEE